jgi:LysM repeat protein
VFVKGVIKAALKDAAETGIYFNEGVWNKIYSDIEKYFPDLSVVGWFAVVPQVTDERMARLKKLHLDNFAGNMKTLYLVDTVEKEEHFYLYENGALKKQKGYVCFYERNYEMQEYMLERSEKKTCEDARTDRVVKNIRNVIKEKEELREQRKSGSFMYGVSAFLVVVIIVIGINLMNNYERMKKLNQSVNNLMNQLEDGVDSGKNNVSDDGSGDAAITVNKLSGDVYPTEDSKTAATDSTKTTEEVKTTDGAAASAGESKPSDNDKSAAASMAGGEGSDDDTSQGSYSTYIVKSGDTLMGICKRHYGTTAKYSEVMQYNGLNDSNVLFIGQEIKLPD